MTYLERLRAFVQGTPAEARAILPAEGSPPSIGEPSSSYDWERWRKKVKATIDEMPDVLDDGTTLLSEGQALSFPEAAVKEVLEEEFALLVRQVVRDQVVTHAEQLRLEQARKLLGLSDRAADEVLRRIVAEAEAFFGRSIEGA